MIKVYTLQDTPAKMTPTEFAIAAQRVARVRGWKAEIARLMQVDVMAVRLWADGTAPLPQWVPVMLGWMERAQAHEVAHERRRERYAKGWRTRRSTSPLPAVEIVPVDDPVTL